MEIKDAIITFKDFHIKYYKAHCLSDENIISYEQEAIEKFKEEFNDEYQKHINIFYLGLLDDSIYYIDADGDSPFFSISFTYNNVTIEWDEYIKKAWYELFKESVQIQK